VLFSLNGTLSYIGFRLGGPPFDLTPAGIGAIFCVYPIGSAIVPLGGRLLRRLGFRGALLVALTVCTVGQAALLAPYLAVMVAGLCIFVTGIFLCQSFALSFVGRAAETGKGAAAGLYVCCFYAGGSLGAVVPGLAWNAAGWTGCVLLVCAALAIGAGASRGLREATGQE
jgi:predicted MFS family arabinose efflux permease